MLRFWLPKCVVSEIRKLLEPVAARTAAKTASTELREEIRRQAALLDGLDPETDPRSLMRHDMAVHRLIYRAAANPHLEEILIRYDNLATRIWCLLLDKLPPIASHIKENKVLLEAIASGDEERASTIALENIAEFERTVRQVI